MVDVVSNSASSRLSLRASLKIFRRTVSLVTSVFPASHDAPLFTPSKSPNPRLRGIVYTNFTPCINCIAFSVGGVDGFGTGCSMAGRGGPQPRFAGTMAGEEAPADEEPFRPSYLPEGFRLTLAEEAEIP